MNKNKILVVEDNQYKLNQIKSALLTTPEHTLSVESAHSFTSAWKQIRSVKFDLIILDISIPTFDKSGTDSGGSFRTFGGKEIALKMKKRNLITNFIFITQYKNFSDKDNSYSLGELKKELISQFDHCLGVILYKNESHGWKKELQELIVKAGIL